MNSLIEKGRMRSFTWPWIVLAGVLAAGIFLLSSYAVSGVGFPLDDAWIHQTYARNLAERGEWAYIPGQPSAGSTSPAWSALLAIGQLAGSNVPFFWTFLLGVTSLVGLGLIGQAVYSEVLSDNNRWPLVGILLAGEWHLVWAAVSGMETAMMAVVVLWILWQIIRGDIHWEILGLMIGACVWLRPDGLTLLGPAVFVLILSRPGWKKGIIQCLRLLGGFLLLAVPYLLFNRLVNGSFWPNTFYAKQAEYALLLGQPIWLRIVQQIFLPMVGVGFFLLPGFLFMLEDAFKHRRWGLLSAGVWFLGYAFMYALRLPVTYQHGRYLMPAMPVYFLLGLIGTVWLLGRIPKTRIGFVLSRASSASIVLVWLAFVGIGARAYATDVAVIQTEMVATARWVAGNTAPNSTIAAHDIGALGYFGQRKLVDLAGLVSPEVIPFIRDEQQIAIYLTEQKVDYLVTFPSWYPKLTGGLTPVYQSSGEFAPAAGGENMEVYRWK